MKHSRTIALLFSCCLPLTCMAQTDTYTIEAEAFQFTGKWVTEKSSECMGSAMLRLFQDNNTADEADAVTVVDIKDGGTYTVWTRARDYADSPGKRTFRVIVGGQPMAVSGLHGREGFYWENVGTAELSAGQVLLRMHDESRYFGRCDALLLTRDENLDPNTLTNTQIARWRTAPVAVESSVEGGSSVPPPAETTGFTTAASASNGKLRISFGRVAGSDRIVCKTDYYANGSWRRYGGSTEDNRLLLICNAEGTTYDHNRFVPAWSYCGVRRTFTLDGTTYQVMADGDNTNPYNAGELIEAVPRSISKTADNTIKVVYDCGDKATVTALWTVPEDGCHAEVRLTLTAKAAGMYSMALQAAKSVGDDDVANVLLPPLFQYRRMMPAPQMMLTGMMQQPVAVIETDTGAGRVSAFVSADPAIFGTDWGGYDYSPAGFSLRGCDGGSQPVAFAPVMGMSDSKLKAGGTVEAAFAVGIVADTWNNALEYVSDNVFGVTDYRRQTDVSLTEAVFNMTDLMADDEYGGWNAAMKGFWDIEANGNTQPTVAQAAPLAVVAQAMLAHDEELYVSRALPTIEYTLSRSGYRWTTAPGPTPVMNPLGSQFTTSYYAGLNEVMGRTNPWMAGLALPDGNLRGGGAYGSSVQPWYQALHAYRLTGDESWLAEAESGAAGFVEGSIYSNTETPMGQSNFYNSMMYGAWWLLTDLYEATHDDRWLQAAQYGAAHTLAGVKTCPQVSDGLMTVHPGGTYDGVSTIWWRGTEKFRLGFPRTAGDAPEHEVDGWKVSPVGLGIEQPATYFLRSQGKCSQPVTMSSWAPQLLRLSAMTGKDIYNVYARNAVIGRSANYPGYYATGYTDITMQAGFPYSGPDVSSIYYHHIPAHIAFTQDFLVSGMISRSGGNISFPYGVQEGFVWFTNRVYGNGLGTVFGDKARLWMRRGLAEVSCPEVNCVTAVSDERFWVILANEAQEDLTVDVTPGKEIAAHIAGTQALVYSPDGTCEAASPASGRLTVSIPRHGLRAVAFETAAPLMEMTPVLEDGMRVIDTGTPAGRIYIYRIRSPFGWDSMYGVAEAGPVAGMTIEVEAGDRRLTAAGYPYEWSLTGYGYDEDVDMKVSVLLGGKVQSSATASFGSGIMAISDTPFTGAQPSVRAIYNMYGMRVKDMTRPGIYVVDGKKIVKK